MKNKLLNVLVLVISILITFSVLEIVVRVYKKEFNFKNYLEEKSILTRAAYPGQYDELLGWIPKEGTSEVENVWGTTVTILEGGIRSNGDGNNPVALDSSGPVLATGDSFTFGDQVSDHETWPAVLEKLLGKRVINAGVFGYGVDQSFLRAEKLMKIRKPDILIFSFIYDDIFRSEFSEKNGAGKAFFEVSGDKLILKNVPAPPPSQDKTNIGRYRRIFGYSFLIHKVMLQIAMEYWLQGRWPDTREHSDGEKVTCLLLQRLDDVAEANNVKEVYVLMQYRENPLPEWLSTMNRVIRCVDQTSITVVDLRPALIKLKKENEEEYRSLFQAHMTYKGNYFIANELKKIIE